MILIYTKCYTKDIYFVDVAALKMHVKIDVMLTFCIVFCMTVIISIVFLHTEQFISLVLSCKCYIPFVLYELVA